MTSLFLQIALGPVERVGELLDALVLEPLGDTMQINSGLGQILNCSRRLFGKKDLSSDCPANSSVRTCEVVAGVTRRALLRSNM